MAGHSKWANIQHRKNAQDAKRGKIFTKMIREITVAAKLGGADPSSNSRLRMVVDKALAVNMTRDTIDRAIKRGAGGAEDQNMEEVRYEGYAPGGVAIIIDCLTDNRNRTVSEVRHALTKAGGNLGTDGSVSYLFAKVGQLIFPAGAPEHEILEVALEVGAEDVLVQDDNSIEVLTSPETFQTVKDAMTAKKFVPADACIAMRPAMEISLDSEAGTKLVKLVEALEDLDDVQEVYHNATLPDGLFTS